MQDNIEKDTLEHNEKLPFSIRIVMTILSSFAMLVLIYFVALWMEAIDLQIDLKVFPFHPFTIIPILGGALLAISFAAVLMLILKTNTSKWKVIFNTIAIIVLILAFIVTLFLPTYFSMIVTLNLMHLVVAANVIYFFEYFNAQMKGS